MAERIKWKRNCLISRVRKDGVLKVVQSFIYPDMAERKPYRMNGELLNKEIQVVAFVPKAIYEKEPLEDIARKYGGQDAYFSFGRRGDLVVYRETKRGQS